MSILFFFTGCLLALLCKYLVNGEFDYLSDKFIELESKERETSKHIVQLYERLKHYDIVISALQMDLKELESKERKSNEHIVELFEHQVFYDKELERYNSDNHANHKGKP